MPNVLHRLVALSAILLLTGALSARAQPSPAPGGAGAAATTPLQAEIDAMEKGGWMPSALVRGSIGWRDNVLLSSFAPMGRMFGRGEVEAMLYRPMRKRWEFVSFVNGDVIRYFSAPVETAGEQQWAMHTEARWQPAAPLRLSFKAVGYLRDMVIDLSETEARRVVAPTRVRGGFLALAPRWTLPGGFRVEPVAQVRRNDYRDYSGDYDETRGGARIEWRRSSALALSVVWAEMRRDYAQRERFTAGGRPLSDTRLQFVQRDGEARAKTEWQMPGGEWFLVAAGGRLENRDGASGYFDYDQTRGRAELGWQRAGWRVLLEFEARRMVYRVQTVGAGIAPPARRSDDRETFVRVERELNARWTIFAEHRLERSRSNEPGFSYRANTALAGVQRAF